LCRDPAGQRAEREAAASAAEHVESPRPADGARQQQAIRGPPLEARPGPQQPGAGDPGDGPRGERVVSREAVPAEPLLTRLLVALAAPRAADEDPSRPQLLQGEV